MSEAASNVAPITALFESIADAYSLVLAGRAKRIDGAGFTVYAVGVNLIRIDVRVAI